MMPKRAKRVGSLFDQPRSLNAPGPGEAMPVVALGDRHLKETRFETHAHVDFAQLPCCVEGVLEVECGADRLVVPPGHAVFIPPDEPHAVEVKAQAVIRSLSLWRFAEGVDGRQRQVFHVSLLLRALVERACDIDCAAASILEQDRRILHLIIDEIVNAAPVALSLPRGTDPRIRRVTDILLNMPEDDRTVETLARLAGASPRNLLRIFRKDTGFTLKTYRRSARIQRALVLMSAGMTASAASLAVGYRDHSTFIQAFRQVTGRTPGKVDC